MTTALVSGRNDLVQNTVYATPGLSKWCLSSAVLQVSTTVGGSFADVAATTTGVLLGGALFVKSTTGAAVVDLSNQ